MDFTPYKINNYYVLLQARESGGGKTSEDTSIEGDKATGEDPSPSVSLPAMVIPTDSMLTETEARLIGMHTLVSCCLYENSIERFMHFCHIQFICTLL